MLKYCINYPYCNYNIIYTLNTTQKKWAKCLHKFSKKKILFEKQIIDLFCDNTSVNQCVIKKTFFIISKKLNLNLTIL